MNDILDYELIEHEETPFAENLAVWIKHCLNPRNCIDIGCGPGMHVHALRSWGIEASGIEPDERAASEFIFNKSLFDLPGTNEMQADLVICMEVAEHIEQSREDEVVQKVAATVGKWLIWTAAVPGQGGVGHINCKPKEEWAAKLEQQGLTRIQRVENEIIDHVKRGYYMGWFVNNILFFEKKGE